MLNKLFKKNYKVLIGLVIGLMISASAVYVYSATYNADAVFYNNVGTNITSNNVKGALDELNNNCKVFSNVKLGDYVIYNPTTASYTISASVTGASAGDQTIYPSTNLQETSGTNSGKTLWRVININSDGTIEVVSYRVTSASVELRGQTGFLNAVAVLNDLVGAYETPGITVGHRHFGYSNQTQVISDTSMMTAASYFTCNTGADGCNNIEYQGGGDTGYLQDVSLITTAYNDTQANSVKATNPSGNATAYWLASRYYTITSNCLCAGVA